MAGPTARSADQWSGYPGDVRARALKSDWPLYAQRPARHGFMAQRACSKPVCPRVQPRRRTQRVDGPQPVTANTANPQAPRAPQATRSGPKRSAGSRRATAVPAPCPLHTKPGARHRAWTRGISPAAQGGLRSAWPWLCPCGTFRAGWPQSPLLSAAPDPCRAWRSQTGQNLPHRANQR